MNGLFGAVGMLPVLGIAQSLAINRFWADLSITGELNRLMLFNELFLSAICLGAVMLLFMLVATGWCISRASLGNSEWGNIIGMYAFTLFGGQMVLNAVRLSAAYTIFFTMCKFGWEAAGSLAFGFLLTAGYLLITYWIMKVCEHVQLLFLPAKPHFVCCDFVVASLMLLPAIHRSTHG